jgi:hypothetical protein
MKIATTTSSTRPAQRFVFTPPVFSVSGSAKMPISSRITPYPLFDIGGDEPEAATKAEPAPKAEPAKEMPSGGSLFDIPAAEPAAAPAAEPKAEPEADSQDEDDKPQAEEPKKDLGSGGSLFDL